MLTFQVIEALQKKTDLSEEQVSAVLFALVDVLKEALTRKGESITVRNLGTFKMVQNKELPDSKDLIFTSLLDLNG